MGVGDKFFQQEFKEHIRIHKPKLVALLETRISGYKAEEVCRRSGYDHWHRSEDRELWGGVNTMEFSRCRY